jgi:hypothetical protein
MPSLSSELLRRLGSRESAPGVIIKGVLMKKFCEALIGGVLLGVLFMVPALLAIVRPVDDRATDQGMPARQWPMKQKRDGP